MKIIRAGHAVFMPLPLRLTKPLLPNTCTFHTRTLLALLVGGQLFSTDTMAAAVCYNPYNYQNENLFHPQQLLNANNTLHPKKHNAARIKKKSAAGQRSKRKTSPTHQVRVSMRPCNCQIPSSAIKSPAMAAQVTTMSTPGPRLTQYSTVDEITTTDELKTKTGDMLASDDSQILATASAISHDEALDDNDITFNSAALAAVDPSLRGKSIDLSAFASTGGQLPGRYPVDIYINHERFANQSLNFVQVKGLKGLQPQLTPALLAQLGVKVEEIAALKGVPNDKLIDNLGALIPSASSQLNFYQKRLEINIPQLMMYGHGRNYVSPSLWDEGIPALLLSYNYSGRQSWQSGEHSNSNFLNITSGANLGAWRYRNNGTFTQDTDSGSHWTTISNYLQRDIQPLKGQLTLGDSSTSDRVFDSIPLRGVTLASDDTMQPNGSVGFMPVIEGIANSPSQITIKQNGTIIYQTYVSAGPYRLTDLPAGSSGSLDITVKDSSGQERHYTQNYGSVPNMLQQGQLQYEVAVGKYQASDSGGQNKVFGLSTVTYGFRHGITGYGGLMGAQNYQAGSLGMGVDLGLAGGLSADISQSLSHWQDGHRSQGQAYRLRYAKTIDKSDTNITVSAYRYTTQGYRSFTDFSEQNGQTAEQLASNSSLKPARQQLQLSFNQSLQQFGSLGFGVSNQQNWDGSSSRNMNASYSNTLFGWGYTVNYTDNRSLDDNSHDRQIAFTLQIPLSKYISNTWASYGLTRDISQRSWQNQLSLGGQLSDSQLNYNLQLNQRQGGDNSDNSGSAGVNYTGRYGQATTSYSQASNNRQWSYGYQGGVVISQYGLTMGQRFTDAVALVKAPGADNVQVQGKTGVATDWRGYTLVPSMSNYRKNEVGLATGSLGKEVDLTDSSSKTVVPTKGAVVLADFKTKVGSKVLITFTHRGEAIPFGATATIVGSDNASLVADGGQAYMTGVPQRGTIRVSWGKEANSQCQTPFDLTGLDKQALVAELTLECH